MLRHVGFVAAVTGKGERAVGQGKDEPAVAGLVPIEHVLANHHPEANLPWRDRLHFHSERARRLVTFEHRADDALRVALCHGFVAAHGSASRVAD